MWRVTLLYWAHVAFYGLGAVLMALALAAAGAWVVSRLIPRRGIGMVKERLRPAPRRKDL